MAAAAPPASTPQTRPEQNAAQASDHNRTHLRTGERALRTAFARHQDRRRVRPLDEAPTVGERRSELHCKASDWSANLRAAAPGALVTELAGRLEERWSRRSAAPDA